MTDAAITDVHKLSLQDARHSIKYATNNLPEQDKLVTLNFLVESLNPLISNIFKVLNSKQLKITN